jgi:hypothetical protein
VPWPWDFWAQAESSEDFPAPLRVHGAPEGGGHLGSDLRPSPTPPIGRRLVEHACQGRILRAREKSRATQVSMTPVADTCGAVLIVALSDGTHPVDGVAGNGGHLFGDQSLAEQPNDLPVAACHGIFGRPIPLLQFILGEVWLNDKSLWHIRIIHPELVSEA